MIGFFEHQYLSYKKNHLKNLLALAKADGSIHEKEIELLHKIGNRFGLKERQIQNLIESNEQYEINVPDNHNDKMNLLYDLISMVYADDVVDKHEVAFCEDTVEKLGLKKEVVRWLIDDVFKKGTPPFPEEWEEIKEQARVRFVVN
jgi:uncharacterized membrane protein YebE (DUF533 family)